MDKIINIKIRYFASLREHLGRSEDQIEVVATTTVANLWKTAHPEQPFPAHTLIAINNDYASLDDVVHDGDEVAFFPPVTGG